MGSTSHVAVNAENQATPRAGFAYDIVQRGLDASFWKTIAATVSVVANKIRLASGGEIASYTQFKYGRFIFPVNVPTTPSAGEAKKWGLLMPGTPAVGSAYFEIAAAVFKCISYDDDGTAETTIVTWDGWEAAETLFEIEWEKDYVIFKVAGTVVASHSTRVGQSPLALYADNTDADNTDLGNVTIKNTAVYV